jgi:hypothetical protein
MRVDLTCATPHRAHLVGNLPINAQLVGDAPISACSVRSARTNACKSALGAKKGSRELVLRGLFSYPVRLTVACGICSTTTQRKSYWVRNKAPGGRYPRAVFVFLSPARFTAPRAFFCCAHLIVLGLKVVVVVSRSGLSCEARYGLPIGPRDIHSVQVYSRYTAKLLS